MVEQKKNNAKSAPYPEGSLEAETRNAIKSAVNSQNLNLSKEEKKEHAKLLLKIFEQGQSPKEAMKISDEEIAEIYSFAYYKFNQQEYADARELFKMLLSLDFMNNGFAISLGICHHRLKDYQYALDCYFLSAFLDKSDPVPLFYAYDCLVQLNNEDSAALMLLNVLKRAGDQPKYQTIKNKAQALYTELEKKINEKGSKP